MTIQPANTVLQPVSASGNIELVDPHDVPLGATGTVNQVAVKAGDTVKAGQVLVTIDTVELERALRVAQLNVEADKAALAKLSESATPMDIASAQATVAQAQANLDKVKAGPTDAQIAAAKATLASAQAHYNELKAGSTPDQLTQLEATVKDKQIALAAAQQAYDQIKWRNNVGMSAEAATLQQATVDYESAVAAYKQATAPALASDMQTAVSAIQTAQQNVNTLYPTPADISTAEATLADAKAKLADLLHGVTQADTDSANIALEQSLVSLQQAYTNLAAAKVTSPISGTVLSVTAQLGQQLASGTVVATVADTSQLELTIQVAEVDIPRVAIGQKATIQIDALPGKQFQGMVTDISPISDASSGVVDYPVTIRLVPKELDGVRPGMTSLATLVDTNPVGANSWLVPSNAIRPQGNTFVVMLVSNGQATPVTVIPGSVQGEWTVVQSPDLQSGDQVAGSVTSYVNQDNQQRLQRFGGGGGVPGARILGGR